MSAKSGYRKLALVLAVVGLAALIGTTWALFPVSRHPSLTEMPDLSRLDPAVAALIGELIADLNRGPREAERHARLAMAYQANNLRRAALKSYEQAVRLDPAEAKWWYSLALARSFAGDSEGATAALDEAIARNERYVPAHWRQGELLRAQGDWAAAEKAFQRALAINPREPAALVGVVRVELQRQNTREALTLLEQLLKRSPNNPFLYQLLGQAYRQAGRYDEAKIALARGKPGEPKWADPWLRELDQYRVGFSDQIKKALRLVGDGQTQQAIPMLESLRKLRPNDVTLLSNLGAAYIETRNYPAAILTLKAALADHPDHFATHLNLSGAYEHLGQLDKALHHAERAIQCNPVLAAGHLRHGALLNNLGRFDDAQAALARARQFDANEIESLVYSGRIECRRKQWAAALPYFEQALERDSTAVAALCGLALATMESGRLDEAQQTLEKVARLKPDDPQYRLVKRRLDELRLKNP
jgi:tetratricopeptide (TPR) repeat protein